MKAVVFEKPGDESVLKIGEAADPKAAPGQLLIRVKYAGLNRADLMQRAGTYPAPPGAGMRGRGRRSGCGSQRMARRRARDGSAGGRRLRRAGGSG